ncbi:hypothetical protein EVA_02902 [gut metagenome]|uniref:Uncharacterized protein n=1 Tax=gut metagenome TaxID=749906 RepID=J9H536_9ZZZZ
MQYFFIKLFVIHVRSIVHGNLLIREEHEVIDENLSRFFQSFLRVNGTVRRNLKNQLVVVRFLLYAERLNSILDITDRRVNRVDWNCINISAVVLVLVSGNITTSFINRNFNLHRGFGI